MITSRKRNGSTLLQVVLAFVILGLLIALLIPAIQAQREENRRVMCKDKCRELGRCFLTYEEAKAQFPKSNYPAPDNAALGSGWSWAITLAPYITPELTHMQCMIYIDKEHLPGPEKFCSVDDPCSSSDGDVLFVAGFENQPLRCPSYSGPDWVEHSPAQNVPKAWDSASGTPNAWVSNYKVTAASFDEGLQKGYDPSIDISSLPGKPEDYPDGVITPVTNWGVDGITDGTMHTFVLAESSEPFCSRWNRGEEMEVVGLPSEMAKGFSNKGDHDYYYPAGYDPENPKYYEDLYAAPGNNASVVNRPFITFPYGEIDDKGRKYTYSNAQFNNRGAKQGAGSNHTYTVTHLYADGSAKSISKHICPTLYYWQITRSGDDLWAF